MLDFPPGGFSTFEEVCTDLLVLPKLIPSELEVVPAVHIVPVAFGGDVAASACGLGCGVCVGFAEDIAGTSPPKEIELPPPGGRITLQKEVHWTDMKGVYQVKLKFVDTYDSIMTLVIHVHSFMLISRYRVYHSPGCRLLGLIEALIIKTVRHDD